MEAFDGLQRAPTFVPTNDPQLVLLKRRNTGSPAPTVSQDHWNDPNLQQTLHVTTGEGDNQQCVTLNLPPDTPDNCPKTPTNANHTAAPVTGAKPVEVSQRQELPKSGSQPPLPILCTGCGAYGHYIAHCPQLNKPTGQRPVNPKVQTPKPTATGHVLPPPSGFRTKAPVPLNRSSGTSPPLPTDQGPLPGDQLPMVVAMAPVVVVLVVVVDPIQTPHTTTQLLPLQSPDDQNPQSS
jgi:hypothetical protein